jgi:hypothetical protein
MLNTEPKSQTEKRGAYSYRKGEGAHSHLALGLKQSALLERQLLEVDDLERKATSEIQTLVSFSDRRPPSLEEILYRTVQ